MGVAGSWSSIHVTRAMVFGLEIVETDVGGRLLQSISPVSALYTNSMRHAVRIR
jgi:hypothetical protein